MLADVIEHMPLGVILLDQEGRVALYNRAEEQLAGRTRERVLGLDFFNEVAPCLAVERLAGYFQANIGRRAINLQFDFSFALPFVPTPRDVSLRLFSLESAGHPFGCIVLEDVSRQRSIERMKETLTALILHDVRSPLTVAMMSLSALEDAPALEREHRDALREGTEALARARRMLRDVLDITRLESDAMPLKRTRTDLCELARASVRANRVLAAAQQCPTVLDLPADTVAAEVDPDVIRRAIDNLLDNAYRHSLPNQRVIVQVERAGASARIAVIDEGPGIPDNVRGRIFDKFVRADPSSAGANHGLGLTLVKLAASAHGGDVTVECPPGGGTRFAITLPVAATAGEPLGG